ncbi:adhesion G protein-coupled receptor F4 [Cololabis saira]|uniref:adhesion G protein-coupled receptor F4 n=1 Tax=Cololabis saira TaxID=129043 RepID=UPI002AD2BD69|nr:adhesion G protein-coupled receptor F4 [Cololabis saira]
MWTLTVLCILAVGNWQAAGKDNSTQMLYTKLWIDSSIIANMSALLPSFRVDGRFNVDGLKRTTTCEKEVRTCTCEAGHYWGDDICRADQSCCGQTCTFKKTPSPTCISRKRVLITGSLSLDVRYQHCLKNKTTEEYKKCHDLLIAKMKKTFSTLSGFETVVIKQFRIGSIIADLEMTVVSDIDPKILTQKSTELINELEARLILETTGVVQIEMPKLPVEYHATTSITCKTTKDLGTRPEWELKSGKRISINNGTVSTITTGTKLTTVTLDEVDELWKGEYKCFYTEKTDNITIVHKAKATLDVCLLPEIVTSTEADFPRCIQKLGTLIVKAKCNIPPHSSGENYNVTWTGDPFDTSVSEDRREYTADYVIDCRYPNNNTAPVNCTFTNRCKQGKGGQVDMKIINVGDAFCSAEGEWKDTKANYEAYLPCHKADGVRRRKCLFRKAGKPGEWGQETSYCVHPKLTRVLTEALRSDNGRGGLEKNAAEIFSEFKNITEKQSIEGFPNLNTSIEVLNTMTTKLKILRDTSVEDFLSSSSHLLNETLNSTWAVKPSDGSNSLADRYLSSVEGLIHKANITRSSTKNNLDVRKCEEEKCTNTVFNVSIVLQTTGHGIVKAAGFQHLNKYLPNNKTDAPNSIVVSTTVEKEKEKARVRITFPLIKKRRRNTPMKCVAWDNATQEWSSNGCDWEGPASEGVCICRHLSSFAILMSQYPVEIKGLTEITYVALSISIVSLVIHIVIEILVWGDVTKTCTLYLRHTAHINISLCLLIANCCFLASSEPKGMSSIWCQISTMIKHFFYLSMFFWMLCMSTTLLHQAVFMFHKVSKKVYLRYSFVLGYACPLLIVSITFIANQRGADGVYFSSDSCWLVYAGVMQGSIFTFIIPMGIIVFVNSFSMLVVIMKLLDHHQNTPGSQEKEKMAAKCVVRSVILLTPIFGLTWFMGFAILVLDLADGMYVQIIHYAFNLMNGFQGLFILLTTCLGDKMTREALLKRFRKEAPGSVSNSSSRVDSTTLK